MVNYYGVINLFKNMTRKDILEYFKNTIYTTAAYEKDSIIALEGEDCNYVGVVLDGTVDIKRISTSDKVVMMAHLSVGDLFGEIVAFADLNLYPATVVASSKCEVMFVNPNEFVKFCSLNTDFLSSFLGSLCNKILTLNNTIRNLSFMSIRHKIVNYILNEYELQNSIFVDLKISKQKLSEYLGVPRPSLSRELINMKNDGLIDYDRNIIKIIDLQGLKKTLME